MKLLIVGLGNIGEEYTYTKHNIGFLIVDHFACKYNADFQMKRMAFITSFRYKGCHIYLLKPTTYMNQSGKALQYWLNFLKIPLENSLIIVDDIALPFGAIRMRPQGSDGGHNGLKNFLLY